jgi:hypothetical protein
MLNVFAGHSCHADSTVLSQIDVILGGELFDLKRACTLGKGIRFMIACGNFSQVNNAWPRRSVNQSTKSDIITLPVLDESQRKDVTTKNIFFASIMTPVVALLYFLKH